MSRKPKEQPKIVVPSSVPWRNRIVGYSEEDADQLLANPRNWRVHPKAQQAALEGSLDTLGWIQHVTVNRITGFVLDGHARAALAISRGEKVPCAYVELSEDEEALAISILDSITAQAGTDQALLDSLIADIRSSDLGQDLPEGLTDLLESLSPVPDNAGLTDEDSVPDVPETPVTQAGDLWLLGNHRLLAGDSTKPEDVARLMDGEKADMVFTDPPYGVDYDGGGTFAPDGKTWIPSNHPKLAGDSSTDLYTPCCSVAAEHSKPESALYLWHAGVNGIAAAAAAAAAGYEIRCEIVWNKNMAQFGALSAQYKQKHEPAYYCFKKGHPPTWYGPTNEVTVWDYDRASVNEFHPTQKPVALAERAMRNNTRSGDVILDLFGGSGSTLIACETTARAARIIEIDSGYCDVIVSRFEAFTGKSAILDSTGQTFAEVRESRLGATKSEVVAA